MMTDLQAPVGARHCQALDELRALEWRTAVAKAALARIPTWQTVPQEVVALLTITMSVHVEELPPGCERRVTALMGRTSALMADLDERRRLVAGRLAAVRSARRAGPAPNLVDYQS